MNLTHYLAGILLIKGGIYGSQLVQLTHHSLYDDHASALVCILELIKVLL